MQKLVLVALGLLLGGCVNGYNPTYFFNEIQVVNLAGDTIEDVSVRIVNSPKAVDCAEVAKFALCDDRFGKRKYPQQGIELSWTHPDGTRMSDSFSPNIPVTYSPAFPLRIVMEINEDGSVKPFYEQEEPSRDGGSLLLGGVIPKN